MEHVPDLQKGDRFLLELLLANKQTGGNVFLSEYVYRSLEEDSQLCYPEGFRWKKNATVNIIVPVKNSGRWALYFIKNIAGNTMFGHVKWPEREVIVVRYPSLSSEIFFYLRNSLHDPGFNLATRPGRLAA